MAATPARATRRRPRRGSLERPVDGRLYRSAFLVVSLPLVILAFSSTRPAALPAPILPPNFDGPSTRTTAADFARTFPVRPPGSARALAAAGWVREQLASYGLEIGGDRWTQHVPGLGKVRSAECLGRRARAVAGRHRRHGPSRRHGDRARGERQRDGHRRADRACAELRADERGRIARRGTDPSGAHDRLPLDRRRCVRKHRSAAIREPAAVPRRRCDQSCCHRWQRPAAARDQRRRPAVTGGCARRDGRPPGARAVRLQPAPREPHRTAPRSGVPADLLRPGPLRRARRPCPLADDCRRAAARGVHGPPGCAQRHTTRSSRAGLAAAARFARPGRRAHAGDDELHLGRRANRARLGDRAAPGIAADSVLRRRRRPVRTLPPAPRPAGARVPRPLQPSRHLGLRRARFLCARCDRRVAEHRRTTPSIPPRRRRGTGPRSRCSCSPRSRCSDGSSAGSGSCREGESPPRRSWPARPPRCSPSGSSRCSFWQRIRSRSSSSCPHSTRGCGFRISATGGRRRERSCSRSASPAPWCSCSPSRFASVSASTRRGTCSSSRRPTSSAFRSLPWCSRPEPAAPSSPLRRRAGTRRTPDRASGPCAGRCARPSGPWSSRARARRRGDIEQQPRRRAL